jgi:hypothetical protein
MNKFISARQNGRHDGYNHRCLLIVKKEPSIISPAHDSVCSLGNFREKWAKASPQNSLERSIYQSMEEILIFMTTEFTDGIVHNSMTRYCVKPTTKRCNLRY